MNLMEMMAEGKSVAASEAIQDVKGGVESSVRVLVSHVAKMYRLFDRPVDLLKHQLFGKFGKDYGKEFWALRDVSFEVGRGESFGVIGRNGAGKSTLLKVLGDIIPIDTPQHAVLLAGGIPLYRGRFGVSQGRNALKILPGGPQ